MTPQMSETIAESCDTETFEFRFGYELEMIIASYTVETPEPPFEDIKDLCSNKPLHFTRYMSLQDLEDETDLREALEAMDEPGSISHEELKKELGI